MTAPAVDTTTGTPVGDTTPPAGAPDPSKVVPPTKTPEQAPPAGQQAETDADKIARLEREVRSARSEAGNERLNAKQQAAKDARDALVQELGKTLGFIQGNETLDPAELTSKLQAAEAENQKAKVENAIILAAIGQDVDVKALLRLGDFDDLDPSKPEDVKAAIEKAVTDWPLLKTSTATQTPGAPVAPTSAQHTGGSGEGAITPERFKNMSYAERVDLFTTNRALYDQLTK